MGQNRKDGESQSDVWLDIHNEELEVDKKKEVRLFYAQIIVLATIISLTILREVLFPSDIVVMDALRSITQ